MNQNYALIIGIHDYRTYDPSGGANVPGARNDARAWYRACLAMGFSPENIRVLTSPPLDPSELGPGAAKATLGEATRACIVEGLTWLSEKISGDAPASGLMTFTGHGDEGEAGCPLLCPSDTTPSLDEVIDVAALRQEASATVKDNLTLMLDCCHAQVGVSAADSIRMRLRAKNAGMRVPERARARVVAACRRDQQSVTARFLGEEMGAFTWAAASALGQWRTVVENGVAELDVSYGNLLARTRALLSALSFEQEPVLSGPAGMANLAFLHPGTAGEQGETRRAPTAKRRGLQLDGGQINAGEYLKYEARLYLSDTTVFRLAEIYVTASDMGNSPPIIRSAAGNTTMEANQEYWVFSTNVISVLQENYATSKNLQMPAIGMGSANISVPDGAWCFKALEETPWTQVDDTTPPAAAYVFSEGTETIRGIALQYQGNTPTNWWWVQTGKDNLTPKDMDSAKLYPNSKNPPSTDYYAASAFTPL